MKDPCINITVVVVPVFSLDEHVIIDVNERMVVSKALPSSGVHGNGDSGNLHELDAQFHIRYADLPLTDQEKKCSKWKVITITHNQI